MTVTLRSKKAPPSAFRSCARPRFSPGRPPNGPLSRPTTGCCACPASSTRSRKGRLATRPRPVRREAPRTDGQRPDTTLRERLSDQAWRAHVLIPMVVLLALLWIAWEAREALVPFAVGLVTAYAVLPLVMRLERLPL